MAKNKPNHWPALTGALSLAGGLYVLMAITAEPEVQEIEEDTDDEDDVWVLSSEIKKAAGGK